MNLEALFRSMMGRAIPTNNQTLELQAGQMVKGVLIKMLSENEALFRIQGTTLHAHLETPVRPGQETWFQVHTTSQSNRIVLKVIGAQGNASLESLLNTLGIKPNEMNHRIVDALMSHRLPVTSSTIATIQQAVRQLPSSVDDMIGMRAGIIAMQKQLPVTPFILQSIVSALGNTKVESSAGLWDEFRSAVMKWEGQEAVNRTQMINQTNVRMPDKGSIQTPTLTLHGNSASDVSQASNLSASNLVVSTEMDSGEVIPVARTTGQIDFVKGASTPRHNGEVPLQGHNTEALRSNDQPAKDQVAQRSVNPQLLVEAFKHLDETVQKLLVPTPVLDGQTSPASAGKGDALRQWYQTVGVVQSTLSEPAESLKSMIIQLLQQPDLPLQVKDSAGQLLQHIAGQQILSLPDQTQSQPQMFVHLPFHIGQGDSATIYIQSRKKKGAGIDPEQCRLFFHLQMKNLGETWVDANIQYKRIDIHIMSDHQEMEKWVKEQIHTLNSGLMEQGYEIRNFSTSPLPEPDSKLPVPTEQIVNHRPDYKGVDYRI